jgi:hypothetical protein
MVLTAPIASVCSPGTGNEVDSVSTGHQAGNFSNVTVEVEGDWSNTRQLHDLFGMTGTRDDLVTVSNQVLNQFSCDPAGATSDKYFTHCKFLPLKSFSSSLTDC